MHVGGFAGVLATALAVNSVSAKDDNLSLRKLQDNPGFSEDQQMLWLDRFSFFRVAGLPYSAANMNQLTWDGALAATAAGKAPTTCDPLLEGTTFEPGFLYHQQPTEGFDPATAVDNAIDEWVKNTAQSTLADLQAPKATGDPIGDGLQNSYSQVVWAAAKKVGCSYSVCSHDSVTTGVVCAFDAASDGSAWYKFGSPTTMCPGGTIGANAMCVEQGQETYFQEVEASVPLESRANEVYAGFITLVRAEEEATDAKPPKEDETAANAAAPSESTTDDSEAMSDAAEDPSETNQVSALDQGNQGADPAAAKVTDSTAKTPVSKQGSKDDTLDGAGPAGAVPAATPAPSAAVDDAASTNGGSAGAAPPGTGSAAKPAEDPLNEDGASMYQNPTEGDGEQTPSPLTTAPTKKEENASPETEDSSAPAPTPSKQSPASAPTPSKQSILTPSPALASQSGSLEGTNANPPSESSASAASTPKPTTKAPSTADTPTFSQAEDPSTSRSSSQGSGSIGKPAPSAGDKPTSSTGDKPASSKDDEPASPGGVVPAVMDGNQDQGKVTGASQRDDDHFTNAKKPEPSAPSPSEGTPTSNVNNQSGAASTSSGLSPAGIAGVIVVGVVVAAGGFVFAGYKKNQAKQRSILESGGLHVL